MSVYRTIGPTLVLNSVRVVDHMFSLYFDYL